MTFPPLLFFAFLHRPNQHNTSFLLTNQKWDKNFLRILFPNNTNCSHPSISFLFFSIANERTYLLIHLFTYFTLSSSIRTRVRNFPGHTMRQVKISATYTLIPIHKFQIISSFNIWVRNMPSSNKTIVLYNYGMILLY